MAKISLKKKLEALSLLEFDFIGLSVQKTKDGEDVAILQLESPIPVVRGSQEVEINGTRYPITANDVKEIKVHEADFNDDFEFDTDTDTGSYKGSELILDVAKSGQVWLRKQSFASAGSEMRTKSRNERLTKLINMGGNKVKDEKTMVGG
jgi:hypothetical protein